MCLPRAPGIEASSAISGNVVGIRATVAAAPIIAPGDIERREDEDEMKMETHPVCRIGLSKYPRPHKRGGEGVV